MDFHRINFDDCIKLNKTTMTLKFDNYINNETIVVIPASILPFVRYEIDEYHDDRTPWFNICGPIVLLLRELAKYRHAW